MKTNHGNSILHMPRTTSSLTNKKNVYMKQKTSKECRVTNIGATAQGLLSAGLDPESIPLLHSLTGYDSTSYLYGIGKSTAWSIIKD